MAKSTMTETCSAVLRSRRNCSSDGAVRTDEARAEHESLLCKTGVPNRARILHDWSDGCHIWTPLTAEPRRPTAPQTTSTCTKTSSRRSAASGSTHTHTALYSVAEWLARLTAVSEDPGSNHAADSCVYRGSSCDI